MIERLISARYTASLLIGLKRSSTSKKIRLADALQRGELFIFLCNLLKYEIWYETWSVGIIEKIDTSNNSVPVDSKFNVTR